jgi:hypothetical protein
MKGLNMRKKCTKCKQLKELTNFFRNKDSKDGYFSWCKECKKAINKLWYDKSTSHLKAIENKEKRKAYLESEEGKAEIKKREDVRRTKFRQVFTKLQKEGYWLFGKGMLAKLRHRSKQHGYAFNLTAEQLENWWLSSDNKCYYCDSTTSDYMYLRNRLLEYDGNNFEILKFKKVLNHKSHGKITEMTIDRLDNGKGYYPENMVKACWFCNHIKGELLNSKDMLLIANGMIQRLKRTLKEDKQSL